MRGVSSPNFRLADACKGEGRFIGFGGAQHQGIRIHGADDLQADGQTFARQAAGHGGRRLHGQIEGIGEGRPACPVIAP